MIFTILFNWNAFFYIKIKIVNILSVKLTKNDDDRAILCYTLFIFNVFSYVSLTRSICRCVSNIRANFNFVFFSIATSYLHTFSKFTRSARSCVCIRQWRACVLVISSICYSYVAHVCVLLSMRISSKLRSAHRNDVKNKSTSEYRRFGSVVWVVCFNIDNILLYKTYHSCCCWWCCLRSSSCCCFVLFTQN